MVAGVTLKGPPTPMNIGASVAWSLNLIEYCFRQDNHHSAGSFTCGSYGPRQYICSINGKGGLHFPERSGPAYGYRCVLTENSVRQDKRQSASSFCGAADPRQDIGNGEGSHHFPEHQHVSDNSISTLR